jgi:hypothetical protein
MRVDAVTQCDEQTREDFGLVRIAGPVVAQLPDEAAQRGAGHGGSHDDPHGAVTAGAAGLVTVGAAVVHGHSLSQVPQ